MEDKNDLMAQMVHAKLAEKNQNYSLYRSPRVITNARKKMPIGGGLLNSRGRSAVVLLVEH